MGQNAGWRGRRLLSPAGSLSVPNGNAAIRKMASLADRGLELRLAFPPGSTGRLIRYARLATLFSEAAPNRGWHWATFAPNRFGRLSLPTARMLIGEATPESGKPPGRRTPSAVAETRRINPGAPPNATLDRVDHCPRHRQRHHGCFGGADAVRQHAGICRRSGRSARCSRCCPDKRGLPRGHLAGPTVKSLGCRRLFNWYRGQRNIPAQ